MTDERDQAAEMQARIDALGEAIRPTMETVGAFIDAFSRAAEAWLEQNRPLIEALGRLAQDPVVRAYAAAGRQPEHPACHCLCGRSHPGEMGVCDMEAVTTRHIDSPTIGPVDVPICAPCAAAQGITELASA